MFLPRLSKSGMQIAKENVAIPQLSTKPKGGGGGAMFGASITLIFKILDMIECELGMLSIASKQKLPNNSNYTSRVGCTSVLVVRGLDSDFFNCCKNARKAMKLQMCFNRMRDYMAKVSAQG